MLSNKFKFIFFFLCALCNTKIYAQDTIYTITGKKMIVEMVQISGDTLSYRIGNSSLIKKISNYDLEKVMYSNGNTSNFSILRKNKAPKVALLESYLDAPILRVQNSYSINGLPIYTDDFIKLMRLQNNDVFKTKAKKLERIDNSKKLLVGFLVVGAGITLGSLLVNSKQATYNVANRVNEQSRYLFVAAFLSSGMLTIALSNSAQRKKKELTTLYNNTYYPK